MRAYVGLGSNLGDREAQIRMAIDDLARLPGSRLIRGSSLYDDTRSRFVALMRRTGGALDPLPAPP